MSKDYDDTNRGALFKNDMTGKSENFPPYGGSVNVDGKEYWISAWVKEGKRGKFFSLAVKPKDDKPQRQQASDAAADQGLDSDPIPF